MYFTGYLLSATNFNALDRKRTDNNFDLTALARHTASATQDIEFGLARKVRAPNLYRRSSAAGVGQGHTSAADASRRDCDIMSQSRRRSLA